MTNRKIAAVVALVGSLSLPFAVTAQSHRECEDDYNRGLAQAQRDFNDCQHSLGHYFGLSNCGEEYMIARNDLIEIRRQCYQTVADLRAINIGKEAE